MERQSAPVPTSRAESVVSAIIELRCSRGGRGGGGGGREQRGLEMQLCEALWVEVNGHDSSWPFAEPFKKKEVRTMQQSHTCPSVQGRLNRNEKRDFAAKFRVLVVLSLSQLLLTKT